MIRVVSEVICVVVIGETEVASKIFAAVSVVEIKLDAVSAISSVVESVIDCSFVELVVSFIVVVAVGVGVEIITVGAFCVTFGGFEVRGNVFGVAVVGFVLGVVIDIVVGVILLFAAFITEIKRVYVENSAM